MRHLAMSLIDHVKEDFDPVLYGTTLLWIAGLCLAHYHFDLFAGLDVDATSVSRLVPFVLFYGVPWGATVGLLALRGRVDLQQPGFWWRATAAVLIVAIADWFPYHQVLAAQMPRPTYRYAHAVLWNLKSTLCWFTPVFLIWWFADRERDSSFYGCTLKGFDPWPYVFCLSILVPLAVWASFQPSFLLQYPSYKPGSAEVYWGVSAWVTCVPYELIYGFDFTWVELYFRGFLVLGMARWLGPSSILPMVAMYAVLHFGKPFPETLGSIVGGYILGVFAYRTKTIASGVMLHLGLAWTMEIAAHLQLWWQS